MELRALVAVLPAKFDGDIKDKYTKELKKTRWRQSVIETLKVGTQVDSSRDNNASAQLLL